MEIRIPIPDGLDPATLQQLDQAAKEAVGIRLYQLEKFTHKQLADYLGLNRHQTDALLHHYRVCDLTPEELDRQFRTIRRLGDGA